MWKKIYWWKCVEKLWGKKIYTLLLKKCEEIQTKCVENSHKKLETSRKMKKKYWLTWYHIKSLIGILRYDFIAGGIGAIH